MQGFVNFTQKNLKFRSFFTVFQSQDLLRKVLNILVIPTCLYKL